MPLDPSIWTPSTEGAPGADGKSILNGTIPPTGMVGTDGDFYINTTAWEIHGPKAGGVWPAGVPMLGADGDDGQPGPRGLRGLQGDKGNPGNPGLDGTLIIHGLLAPTVDIGRVGDYYLHKNATMDWYGPKAEGTWGVPTPLKGIDGDAGPAGADAVPIPLAYGQLFISENTDLIALTAATDPTLASNTDYTQVTAVWDATPHGLQSDFEQVANGLKCLRAGVYAVHFWAALTFSTNNTNVGFKFAKNGVIATPRRPWARVGTGGDRISVSAFGFVELAVNDVMTLWVAADNSGNLDINDGMFAFTELMASGRHAAWQEEGATVLDNPAVINFVGDGVTVTEDPAGTLKVTIPGEQYTGVVESVVAGDNVSVDATDPANPIVAVSLPSTAPYDVGLFVGGKPDASELLVKLVATRDIDFVADFADSLLHAGVAATASTVFAIAKNGTGIGSVTVGAAATTGTFTTSATPVSLAAGDVLTITAPGTPDATLADISITLKGTRDF